ncbi:EGF-like repeat and discoidin I-like domain-containing protein 3 [Dreissena polymorpha]|uniref:EGF-like repeat and discoidin I-like domain-containing protein 3 n=1 Tax=Dreissena polymorpha TaxID=45954 RepID=UPI0022649608|nr:EGF-like repeat and discoidin I-like domain-containing protein 3 [Dreissena polymorpha]XP_052218203.1 EGF-like repeat and discoidin I-like domain-containing protein 3 [Dreissena polymorpha]
MSVWCVCGFSELDQCRSNPCKNNGVCTDACGNYTCHCTTQYGGRTCTINCENEAVGVAYGVRKIPDAQMSGYYAFGGSDHKAYEGPLESTTGWIGENAASWLQIDFGDERKVHAVATQGYSDTFNLVTYKLACSVDGNSFIDAASKNFTGSGASFKTITKQVLPSPVICRYLRFLPLTWTNSHPGFRVEVYACDEY